MIPDVFAPTTCTTCGAVKSHDVRQQPSLRLLGRVFECGAAVSVRADGVVYPAIGCPRSAEIIAQLRADNVRIGDRDVLLAIAMQAAIDDLELALRDWATRPLDLLPRETLLKLAPLRAAYDELVDVLEGAAPTPAAEAAPVAPDHGLTGVEQTSAAEHVGERSLDTP